MSAFRPIRAVALIAAILAFGAACASDPVAPRTLEALPRPLSDAETAIGASGNGFTFDLLRQVNKEQRDSNVFLSPLSASMALGLTMNGAVGTTADEMRRALGFGEIPLQTINEGYRGLIGLLRGLDPSTELRVANSIFHDRDFPFEQSFFSTGRTWFDAEVEGLDFHAPASVGTINDWASRATNGKIPKIMEEIDPDAVMFVINAVYFKGSWRSRFDPEQTADAQFRSISGASEPMKLMHQQEKLRYFEDAELQAVDLLYGNTAFTMTVLLPRGERDVNAIAEGMTASAWADLAAKFTEREVDLYLPKIKLEYERTLNDDLKALGMVQAFLPDVANFTAMSPRGDLFVSSVKQKTFVDIYEEGTEAAAVTTVTMAPTSMPVIPVMRVDRPYLFAIRERFSGTILFVGKIVRMPASRS